MYIRTQRALAVGVSEDNEDLDIDGSFLFDCKTCAEKYGECSSNINCSECSERFERYCREDT